MAYAIHTHLQEDGAQGVIVPGRWRAACGTLSARSLAINRDPRVTTCGLCKRSQAWRLAMLIAENVTDRAEAAELERFAS